MLADSVFDDCILTYFKAPHSATGEDVVEISIHGGEYLQNRLLEVLVKEKGVRFADAGEFTLRAFLNGRLDLTRAEAVADLIHARDAASHRNAQHQLHGRLESAFSGFHETLMEMITHIEAELDFSDQEIELVALESYLPGLEELHERVQLLLDSYFYGKHLHEGFRIPIIGPPNAGKSTLFNALVGMDRAIVTEKPGTPRDTIEASKLIGDHTAVLVDTAGIREAGDNVEQSGVSRSLDEIARADIVIQVHSPDTEPENTEIPAETPCIAVFSKADLSPDTRPAGQIAVSGLDGTGLGHLQEALAARIAEIAARNSEGVIITTRRHVNVLERFLGQLKQCRTAITDAVGPEYLAADLREALHILGEITGETTPDEILDQIFNGFCIGK